jgi:mRNA interferase MazF
VQDDRFDATPSVSVCALTTTAIPTTYARVPVRPSPANGLREVSEIMVDKITTVPRERLAQRVGALDASDASRLNEALALFLGLGHRRRRITQE